MLRANLAVISMCLTLAGSSVSAIWIVSGWVTTLSDRVEYIERQDTKAEARISILEANIVSLDKRANEISAEHLRLYNAGQAFDATMRARIDVLEERTRPLLNNGPRVEPGRGR